MKRVSMGFLTLAAGLSLAVAGPAFAADPKPLPAFPGAEGYGAQVTGGRAGKIVHVTNLNDAGAGSLRDAVSKDSRFVVFDVAGFITLKSALSISSDITIAGQSAPGEGISVNGYEVSVSNSHNVIIRYIHFRQGLTPGQEKKYVLGMSKCKEVIVDHVSLEWGRWDIIGMSESENITIQNCIIGEGIDPQRFGCLCESDNVTFSHNLWIDNQSRNPKGKGKIQYINNVVYNFGVAGYVGGHSAADHEADLINNMFIRGPDSGEHFLGEFTDTDKVFQSGNMADTDKDGKFNPRPVVEGDFGEGKSAPTFVTAAHLTPPVPVTVDEAEAAYKKVIASAGASWHRDVIDKRIVAEAPTLGKEGKIIKDPKEVGGLGQAATAPAPSKDTDKDGIPDDWETAHKLNPNDAADAEKLNADGYTNLEAYLNSLVQ